MLSVGAVVAAALLWLAVLFGTGLYAERHPTAFAKHWRHIYALSLAVHCTSWTFYGTVTQAARYGWPLPPTFIGAILCYTLAVFFWCGWCGWRGKPMPPRWLTSSPPA